MLRTETHPESALREAHCPECGEGNVVDGAALDCGPCTELLAEIRAHVGNPNWPAERAPAGAFVDGPTAEFSWADGTMTQTA